MSCLTSRNEDAIGILFHIFPMLSMLDVSQAKLLVFSNNELCSVLIFDFIVLHITGSWDRCVEGRPLLYIREFANTFPAVRRSTVSKALHNHGLNHLNITFTVKYSLADKNFKRLKGSQPCSKMWRFSRQMFTLPYAFTTLSWTRFQLFI